MIPALLGAFATVASGALGAAASQQAADTNWRVNLLNYNQRERERFDSIQQARRQDADTKLGSTDAAGNRSYFKPGVGWIVDLADNQQRLQDLYQNEELQQLQNDLPKKREILNSNVDRQRTENTSASALLDAFKRIERPTSSAVENNLNAVSAKGINEAFDNTLNEAMRTAVRSGASNSGKIAADIGSKRASMLADAFMNNKNNAVGQAQQMYDTERGNIANLYNMFATRASAMPDVTYAPRNIEGATQQQSQANAGANNSAVAALINAFAKQGGSMSMVEPNYGLANAVGSGGNALAAAFKDMQAQGERKDALNMYSNFAGLDANKYRSGKGIF